MASDVRLIVDGVRYGGWKEIRVTRSIESIAGSFALEVLPRDTTQADPWPIAEESECRVEIDGEAVIVGRVDRRSPSIDATTERLSYSGRDASAILVDCSALLADWTFRKATVLDVARKVAAPFGVPVSIQQGIALPSAPAKFVVAPGERAFDTIIRAAKPSGVLVVSDGAGGIKLVRAGTSRATSLVLGGNILTASGSFSTTDRYSRYVVLGQTAGTDKASGTVTSVLASAVDEGVKDTNRVLVLRPSGTLTVADAQRLADWEARIRAARADSVTISVHGWHQSQKRLWAPNEITRVTAGRIGIDGDMLISQVDYTLGPQGELATLRLVRPDAFTPEPTARVKSPKKKKRSKSWDLWKLEG